MDFTYVDEAGETHFWQFPGTGSHSLREVLGELGINVEGKAIIAVDLTRTETVGEFGENDLYLSQDLYTGDWFINSDAAFDDTYELAVTVDGKVYTIIVTDDQNNINISINLYEEDGITPVTQEELASLNEKSYCILALFDYTNWQSTVKTTGFEINSSQTILSFAESNPIQDIINVRIFEVPKSAMDDKSAAEFWGGVDQNNFTNEQAKILQIQPFSGSYEIRGNWSNDGCLTIDLVRSIPKTYAVRMNVEQAGLDIKETDRYYVYVEIEHENTQNSGGFAPIEIQPGQSTVDIAIDRWYNVDNRNEVQESITADMVTSISIYRGKYANNEKTYYETFEAFNQDLVNKEAILSGASVGGYNVSFDQPHRGTSNNTESDTILVYDEIYFTKPDGDITKGYIDSFMNDATDFGYYTEEYSGQSGDIEATIGAATLSAVFNMESGEHGYGYSGRNLNVNILKVLKVYKKADGTPIPDQHVTIRLKDKATGELVKSSDGSTVIGEKEGITGADGTFRLEYTNLAPGEYTVSEVINGVEVSQSTATVGDVHVNFSATQLYFLNNTNLNYFGTITYINDDEKLDKMLEKGSRVDMVVLTDAEEDVDRINDFLKTHTYSNGVMAAQNGESGYKHYDIMNDMNHLRALSDRLATAESSSTVRVLNVKASELKDVGLELDDDGRYIVVNVEMDRTGTWGPEFCPTVLLNGRELIGDFGQGGKDNSSKVLFNLRGTDGSGFGANSTPPIDFNTNKGGAGIILAPWANAHYLEGLFGGTIISKTVHREGNELHSDSPNRRQTLNITIQNVEGEPQVGMLELRKAFANDDIKDKTTYFTFMVVLSNSNAPEKVQGQSFPASGLKAGEEVTFDDNGVAYVQVRADNTVTIANLPEGTTFTVTEVLDEGSAYVHKSTTNDGTGTITAGQTAHVVVTNDVPRTGLTLEKVVEGQDETSTSFNFKLYLWEEEAGESTTYTAVTGTYSGHVFAEATYNEHAAGVTALTLTKGNQITIDGIKQGVHYALVETECPEGYVYGSGNTSGVLTGTVNGTTVTFTNIKLGALNITKAVTAGSVATGVNFTFEVTLTPLDGTTIDPNKLTVIAAEGTTLNTQSFTKDSNGSVTGTVVVTGTGTVTIKGFPEGTGYSVTEIDIPAGWRLGETTYGNTERTITNGVTDQVTVTNEELISIPVAKQWISSDNVALDWPDATTVKVGLFRKDKNSADEPEAVMEAYTTADDESTERQMCVELTKYITDTFNGLPKYDSTSGVEYEYSVKEISVTVNGETYTIDEAVKLFGSATSTAQDGTGKITVINRLPDISLNVVKLKARTNEKLSGAKFQMTRKLPGDSTYTKFVHDGFEEITDENGVKANKGPFTVNETATISGLLPGQYTLTEAKAPDGYIISSGTVYFTVYADGTVSCDVSGDSLITFANKSASDPATFKIGNEPGVALPATGGMGTGVVYALGAALLALAVLGLVWKGRKKRCSGDGID